MIQRLKTKSQQQIVETNSAVDQAKTPYHRPHDPWVFVPAGSGCETAFKKPGLRQHRRNFSIACTAFVIGAVLVLCSSPWRNEFLVPGALSSHHAPLIASEGGARCAACHANANGSLTNWIASVFRNSDEAGISQSELCMKCHAQSLVETLAMNPHNVQPHTLAKLSMKANPNDSTVAERIACSICHQEHHGGKNLTKLTDSQCQSCHSNSFHSFENGHPEFVDYPQQRRSRIAFDHTTHANRHFVEKQQAFHCDQCHVDDPFQDVKRLASFEQSCAACHNQQILESGSQGLALIALPMLDMTAIEGANLKVGGWPLTATGDFDGEIPPMMRLMLNADPIASEVFQRHPPDVGFFDFDADNPDDVADAVTLVWAIKRLLWDLAQDGPQAIRQRLQTVLSFEISDQSLQQIITNLDEPVFQNAVQSWLPQLSMEIADDGAIRDQRKIVSRTKHGPHLPFQQTSYSTTAIDPVAGDVSADENLLAVNPLVELMKSELAAGGEAPDRLVPPAGGVPPSKENTPPSKIEVRDNLTANAADPGQTRPPAVGTSNLKAGTTKLKDGAANTAAGWYRNDQTFRISYRPSGHADECLQSWIELVARVTDANTRTETKQLFEKTISLTGIGLCRTCHTVDQLPDRSFAINWQAEYRDPSIRSFTRFSHGPHLLQAELRDCSHCHRLDPSRANADSFLGIDASQVVSNFFPTTKSSCVQCHQSGRTDSNCTHCHNYHVGSHVIGGR